MRRLAPLALSLLIAGPAAAAPPITAADVRAFLASQEQAWNARNLTAYFAGFTADARFTDQAYAGDEPPVPYGSASLAEARVQARRAKARSREVSEVMRIEIARDGASARVVSRVGSRIEDGGRSRRLCASREQTLVQSGGRLRSRGPTDTYVRCRRS